MSGRGKVPLPRPHRAPGRGQRAALTVVVALGVLMVAVLAASSPTTWGRVGPGPTPRSLPEASGAVTAPAEAAPTTTPAPVVQHLATAATVATVVCWVVLGAAVALGMGMAVVRAVRRGPPGRGRAATAEVAPSVGLGAEELSRHVEDWLGELRVTSDADRAIVDCWEGLEELAARNGVPRDPAWTTTEFATRVVDGTPAGAEPVADLAELYREVVHSTHPGGTEGRQRAIDDLATVRRQLMTGADHA